MPLPVGLEQFFAPAGPTTAGGVGAPASADGSTSLSDVAPERLDYTIPTRAEDPDLWDTCYVSEIPLPPNGTGQVKVSFSPKAKLDKKTGAGKAKPRVTVTGAEPTDGEIEIEAGPEAWPAIVAAAATLQPGTGPFAIRHPKATMAKVTSVMIAAWADAPDMDANCICHWKIPVTGFDAPAQTGTGGKGVAGHKETPACRQLRTEYANLLGEQRNLLSGVNGDPIHDAAIHIQNLKLQTAISSALIMLEEQGCNVNAGAATTTPKSVSGPTFPGDPSAGPIDPAVKAAYEADKATAGEDGSAP